MPIILTHEGPTRVWRVIILLMRAIILLMRAIILLTRAKCFVPVRVNPHRTSAFCE